MKKEFTKYFWGFNNQALLEAGKALRDINHPRFAYYAVILFSRCDEPKEAFRFISKDYFILGWPKIKSYWRRLKENSEFRDWWQVIYERMLEEKNGKSCAPKERSSSFFKAIGSKIRENRLKLNMSQKELARSSGVRQPDISKIEEGKQNITLETLIKICKIIGLKEINTF
ncbi:MAG: helix-turn-helix transcriptional regulator [Candidatus Omnitrophota bacterium]